MTTSLNTLLATYSATVTTALLVMLLMGAKPQPQTASFDQIRVHRIDLVEPDGTLRMVLSNKDRLPPVMIKGVEQARGSDPRPQAGMLFYNDEGTENGGLIFGGHKNDKGEVVDSGGSLSFDKYGAGQVLQLAGVDDKEDRFAGMQVTDGKRRIWAGRDRDGVAGLTLAGADGKKRIQIRVAADGTPSLAFFDAHGKLLQELAPASPGRP